ncbi:uncharacterized protein METZ01_LOCUS376902, partial [marine metagenome]
PPLIYALRSRPASCPRSTRVSPTAIPGWVRSARASSRRRWPASKAHSGRLPAGWACH